ncbi:MAG: hypothetical protein OQK12_12915 [Motiliproteus sp.]|nr:hypothetical protein [Motiliproteus sp.]MCW9054110.1 hypothetical protein [Motiliproteus sp.]
MSTTDNCVTIVPYFKIQDGQTDAFKALCEQCVSNTEPEQKCLFYGFSFYEDMAHCREGYQDADGLLIHLDRIGSLLQEILAIASLERLEVHGPEQELAKLRGPLAELSPQFYTLEYGFRR